MSIERLKVQAHYAHAREKTSASLNQTATGVLAESCGSDFNT